MEKETPQEKEVTPESLVTEDHVKQVLLADKGKEARLKSWKLEHFTKPGDNYSGMVICVQVIYSLNNEEHTVPYIAKLSPLSAVYKASTGIIFKKEAKFYSDIIPELNSGLEAAGLEPLRFPKYFHSCLDPDHEQIYFEDLRARGFKMPDRSFGLSEAHAKLVIQELARLHAASYLLQAKSPHEPLEVKHPFVLGDIFQTFGEDMKKVLLPGMQFPLTNAASMLEKIGGQEKYINYLESLMPRVEAIVTTEQQSTRFGSICHGDCWNNNMLFRYDNEGKPVEVMLLDLQICQKASLARDLNYFLLSSLTGDVRGPHLSNFLATYHSSYKDVLKAQGLEMHFTQDELLKEYRDKHAVGVYYCLRALPAVLMDSDEVPDTSGENVDMDKIREEVRAIAVAKLDTNPSLKRRFLSIFDELVEAGIIS